MSINVNGRRAIGGSSMHNYSTDEHIVGTWIDGSTIYEKTFNLTKSDFTRQNANFFQYVPSIENRNKIISKSGYCKTTSYGYTMIGSKSLLTSTYNSNYIEFDDYYTGVCLACSNDVLDTDSGWTVCLTYQYTKSSS